MLLPLLSKQKCFFFFDVMKLLDKINNKQMRSIQEWTK